MLVTIVGCAVVGTLSLVAWISGQARVGIVRITTQIDIKASREDVWRVLTSFDTYEKWNPLMFEVRKGEPRVGVRMEWSSRINGAARNYDAVVTAVKPMAELAWTGPVSGIARILFWGEHQFFLEDSPDDGVVTLTNTEQFGGVLTPVLSSFLKGDVCEAYRAANRALKHRAEEQMVRVR